MSDQFKQGPSIKKRHVAFAALLGCSVTQLANYQFDRVETGSFVPTEAPVQELMATDSPVTALYSTKDPEDVWEDISAAELEHF
jgi:hypothetical protein